MSTPLSPTQTKRLHGQFLTTGNPFTHPAFAAWWATCERTGPFLEPFAGADGLPGMLAASGYVQAFDSFDIDPQAPTVTTRDTLAHFPVGYSAIVTNPPYLARHFARRKKLDVDHLPWGPYNNLWKVAIDLCLAHAGHVAAIIPESFVTSGLFRERLVAVVSLTQSMFEDTEMPTCLALWGPERRDDFDVWCGLEHVGSNRALTAAVPAPGASAAQVRFNVPDGLVGLRAIDGTVGPTIAFVPASAIPVERVKHSARLATRIAVADLGAGDVPAVLERANALLGTYRAATGDVLLTAFKGVRRDGKFRRRIDYVTARALLSQAVDEVSRQLP